MKRFRLPAIALLCVLVPGFLALNLYWLMLDYPDDLPGLYTFRSATIGDGLLLPLLAFIATLSTKRFSRVAPLRRRIAVIAGLSGASVGALTQFQWLLSDSTVLNWTIPEQHTFNAAGWHHAVFLVVAGGFLAGLTTSAIVQLAEVARSDAAESASVFWAPYLLGITFTGSSFLFLVCLDNSEIGNWGEIGTFAAFSAVAMSVAIICLGVTGLARVADGAQIASATLCISIAVALLFWHGPILTTWQFIAIAMGLIAGFFQAPLAGMKGSEQLAHGMMSGLCIAGPIALGARDGAGHVTIFLYLLVAFLLARTYHVSVKRLRYSHLRERATGQRSFIASFALLYLIYTGLVFAEYPDLFEFSGATIWVGIASLWAINRFILPWAVSEMNAYWAYEKVATDRQDLLNRRINMYLTVLPALVLGVCAIISIGNGTIAPSRWQSGDLTHYRKIAIYVALIVLILAVRRWVRPLSRGAAGLAIGIVLVAWILWSLPLIVASWPSDPVHWVFALILSIGVGAFVGEGFMSNLSTIHLADRDSPVIAAAILVGLTSMTTSILLLTAGVGTGSAPTSRIFTLVCAVVALIAFICTSSSVAACLPAGQRGFHPAHMDSPLGSAVQDAFIGWVMAVFFGLGPLFAMVGIGDFMIWAAYYVLYLGFLSIGATYLIHINVEFLENRKKMGPIDDHISEEDNERAVQALIKHVRFQNVLCAVVLFPLVLKQFLEDGDRDTEAGMPDGIWQSVKRLMAW